MVRERDLADIPLGYDHERVQWIASGIVHVRVRVSVLSYVDLRYADLRRCITSPPRLWTEVSALFAAPVSDVFSGGMAFSYFPTSDGYGMVNISSDGKRWVCGSGLIPCRSCTRRAHVQRGNWRRFQPPIDAVQRHQASQHTCQIQRHCFHD